jgi:hypothetical protein
MHSYLVALRITGKALNVTDVTHMLGITPTQTRIQGQLRPGGRSVWDESMWEYEVRGNNRKGEWRSLEGGLDKILSRFAPSKKILRRYQRGFKVQLFCGHFSSSFNGGPKLSPALLKRLGNFGVELFLDTYSSIQSVREG